jgi:hypothetical protein
MRDRIWTEITQAKFNVEFAALYADRQRSILRYFNIFILVFSTGGVMGWAVWDRFPLVSCIIISAVSLLRQIQPQLIMTDNQIINLDSISKFYFNYYNALEKLWYINEDNLIDKKNLQKEFFKIKNSESQINSLVDETIRNKPKKLVKKAKMYSDQYFKLSFNTINNG